MFILVGYLFDFWRITTTNESRLSPLLHAFSCVMWRSAHTSYLLHSLLRLHIIGQVRNTLPLSPKPCICLGFGAAHRILQRQEIPNGTPKNPRVALSWAFILPPWSSHGPHRLSLGKSYLESDTHYRAIALGGTHTAELSQTEVSTSPRSSYPHSASTTLTLKSMEPRCYIPGVQQAH